MFESFWCLCHTEKLVLPLGSRGSRRAKGDRGEKRVGSQNIGGKETYGTFWGCVWIPIDTWNTPKKGTFEKGQKVLKSDGASSVHCHIFQCRIYMEPAAVLHQLIKKHRFYHYLSSLVKMSWGEEDDYLALLRMVF